MNILLLAGGSSNERDVSLRSGEAVASALDALGYSYVIADPVRHDFMLVDLVRNVDAVFPVLHGSGGEDGILQAELERLRIPCVGSGSQASKLCWDKTAYKKLLIEHGLPASQGKLVTAEDTGDDFFEAPYVLKPVEGGSSLDTQIVRKVDGSTAQTRDELLRKYPQMLLEPLIEGIEITVGILDEEPLPVIEIIPPEGSEFDYENKYNGATQELCPPQHVGDDLQLLAQELALRIHKLAGCEGMSRTDMIIDKAGRLHVLETNTIPGLTGQSLLPKMAAAAGYSMAELVEKLLELAVSRQP